MTLRPGLTLTLLAGALLATIVADGVMRRDFAAAARDILPARSGSNTRTVKTESYDLTVEIFDLDLDTPWSIAFLDDRRALVTDKSGALYHLLDGRLLKIPVQGLPEDMIAQGQGGLLDVVPDPDYALNGWIYLSYSQALPFQGNPRRARAMTRIIRGRINDNHWIDQQVIFQAAPQSYSLTRHHYGSRIVFDKAGLLYFSVGDRGERYQAQDLTRPNGKIHRLRRDGSIPPDNPFLKQPDALPSIFSYGHRNPQGLATHPQSGEIWSTEHGPMGGDELNLIRRGRNYGWPEITHGRNYDGTIISKYTAKPGMEQPVVHWTPSTAVSDIDFYHGDLFPDWRNNLLVTSLKYQDLRRLVIEKDRVIHQEILLKDLGRLRAITIGPDEAVYILINRPSQLLRLAPRQKTALMD